MTEHIGGPNLTYVGDDGPDKYIHDRDMEWLLSASLIVAEVTVPSLGVGYEIGRAFENKIPIVCLFRRTGNKHLSAMISGNIEIVAKEYKSIEDIKAIFQEFFEPKIQ